MHNYYLQGRLEKLIKGLLCGDIKWNTDALDVICDCMYRKTEFGEEKIDTNDICDEAVELKRSGNYELALLYYLDVIEGTLSVDAGVPAKIVWSMSKVLISMNEYLYAYMLLNDCLKILLPYAAFFNDDEQYVLFNINNYVALQKKMCNAIKNGQFMMIELTTKSFSGNSNYEFVLSHQEITQQYQVIETMENYAKQIK